MTFRIGIVGTDNGHAHLFSGWVNGWAEDVPIPARPAGYLDSFYLRWAARRTELVLEASYGEERTPIPGVEVSKIWGAERADAEAIAVACGIRHVAASVEEACSDVDAVMVLSDSGADHFAHAKYSLAAGLPTYIDKPLALTARDAREIADFAEGAGARWFSASSLGFSYQVKAARALIRDMGGVRSAQVKVQNRWWDYGIHSVELIAAFIGRDVASVRGHTVGACDVVVLEYRDGRVAVLQHVGGQSRPSYCASLFGGLGTHFVDVTDGVVSSLELIEAFVAMARDGGPTPVSPDEAVQSIAIVEAGMKALASGEVVKLPPGANA